MSTNTEELRHLEEMRLQLEEERLRLEQERAQFEQERNQKFTCKLNVYESDSDEEQIAEPKTLRQHLTPKSSSLKGPLKLKGIAANNMTYSPALVNLVQQNTFHGNEKEDPHFHLKLYLECCNTFKMNGVSKENIRLLFFTFSLKDKAKKWWESLRQNSIESWDQLVTLFLNRYYPHKRTAKVRSLITGFEQKYNEPIHEAWERFRDLQISCPHHGLPDFVVIQSFYDGLIDSSRVNVDAFAGGSLMDLEATQAIEVIDELAMNLQWAGHDNSNGGNEAIAITSMQTQMAQIRAEMAKMTIIIEAQSKECSAYGDKRHPSTQCPLTKPNERPTQVDSLNYESFYFPNQPCSSSGNVYHNVAHDNNHNQNHFPMSSTIAEMQNFMQEQGRINRVLFEKLDKLETTLVKSLEKKLEATLIAVTQKINQRQSDHVPSQSNPNPRAECKTMTLKNWSNYEGFIFSTETEQEKQEQPQTEHNLAHTNLYKGPIPEPENHKKIVQPEPENNPPKPESVQPEPPSRTLPNCPERRGKKTASEIHSKYAPPAPFPRRLLPNRIDQEFRKFIDMIKELEVTIPLVDAIAQIPKHAKF